MAEDIMAVSGVEVLAVEVAAEVLAVEVAVEVAAEGQGEVFSF